MMSLWKRVQKRDSERMSDFSFRAMSFVFNMVDFLHPYIDKRVTTFGIREGMTVVDYGCGPGRYTTRFSKLVGETGRVYAVDIHQLAVEAVKRKTAKHQLQNVVPILASGYHSTLPEHTADVVCALDMFFAIQRPAEFLGELKRITRQDGMLIIDDGHQPREMTKKNILESGHWVIGEETRDHLKCRPSLS
jgi:ubiquinone/menaquinone biosynthesis C-methylase UbiE